MKEQNASGPSLQAKPAGQQVEIANGPTKVTKNMDAPKRFVPGGSLRSFIFGDVSDRVFGIKSRC